MTNIISANSLKKSPVIPQAILKSDYDTIEQVALSVGYNSIYHFSKMFKLYTGKSPLEYGKVFILMCCICLDTLVSGSPIIQNGKLVGVLTHVLIDNPQKGYGIFAENMLETAQSVANEQLKYAS